MRLSTFVASFLRRIMRAAAQHRGVVDRFAVDGALVVVGLSERRADDAARAPACARTLPKRVDPWSRKRQVAPPVRMGTGVHAGEAFFDAIGDETRRELAVLGDAVNVAARLEQATNVDGAPLLASSIAVDATGKAPGRTESRRGCRRCFAMPTPPVDDRAPADSRVTRHSTPHRAGAARPPCILWPVRSSSQYGLRVTPASKGACAHGCDRFAARTPDAPAARQLPGGCRSGVA